MTFEEFVKKLDGNQAYMDMIARRYHRVGNLSYIAVELGLDENIFDRVFTEYPLLEDKFNDRVSTISVKAAQRSTSRAIFRGIDKLVDIVNGLSGEDPKTQVSAMSVALQAYKLVNSSDRKASEIEDDLDTLWKQVERERKTTQNLSDSPKPGT